MSLLHATWLPVVPAGSFAKGKAPTAGLLIWRTPGVWLNPSARKRRPPSTP